MITLKNFFQLFCGIAALASAYRGINEISCLQASERRVNCTNLGTNGF
nr:MAG TPA: hypothetical protein [Caudoviricetes sp.]